MNTPKQILIYKALGSALPTFGHVPMVLGQDRTRLSKRHGAMSVTAYRDMGYLPEAVINYLVRLGWSYGDQEFFTREELIRLFNLENIGRSAGVFDPEKLLALNADHIQAAAPSRLAKQLAPFLKERGVDIPQGDLIERVIKTLQPRSKTLVDMAEAAMFYFQDTVIYEPAAAQKFLKTNVLEAMQLLRRQLENLADFSEAELEAAFQTVMEKTGLKLGKIAQPVRVALTGRAASPGIFEITSILGRTSVLKRIDAAIRYIEAQGRQTT
jgi:glutamyl-tRNA synthetase